MQATYHAAIVLCGGESRRMGRDKASLPFGDETMLQRTVRIVGETASEILVVARPGQEVEIEGATVIHDDGSGIGPLAGLIAGLAAMEAESAFLTSCDVPFLLPEYVRFMLDAVAGRDMAVARVAGFEMVTAAAYRKTCLAAAEALVASGQRRPRQLIDAVDCRVLEEDEVRTVDPGLVSFRNCNTPEQYAAALRDSGFA